MKWRNFTGQACLPALGIFCPAGIFVFFSTKECAILFLSMD
ncbi:hypothetical protein BACCAP_01419 [Pseudoflavonifractor capillosus ATCC 29799]|uniref:Uncharacterized protein n=1 Tax=Pseudoflavonifractor capillosus ATCC 29799 TaxID=411467 RepID=A6NT90_9FIRM|nr:hypothetical protein BACCAP_01419 [Pseudoflavonifractor capillosus ATCC 29799]